MNKPIIKFGFDICGAEQQKLPVVAIDAFRHSITKMNYYLHFTKDTDWVSLIHERERDNEFMF